MNDLFPGMGAFLLPVLVAVAVVFVLIIWFFINRASVRANDKVLLLEALLREQKKQNALLKRLIENQTPEEPAQPEEAAVPATEDSQENGYLRFVPER